MLPQREIDMLAETVKHTTVYKDLVKLDRSISEQRRQEFIDLIVNTAMVYMKKGYEKSAVDRQIGKYKI